MKIAAAALLIAASLAIPATAYADCGDDGQPACTGPVPTVDQVVGIMHELTDPNIPAGNKGDIVTPGFSPDEAGTIDDERLRRKDGRSLPLNFNVTDIRHAPANLAGATVSTSGPALVRSWSPPGPIVLANQGGRWMLTHDSAMTAMHAFWHNATR
jgi:hypothetical protein